MIKIKLTNFRSQKLLEQSHRTLSVSLTGSNRIVQTKNQNIKFESHFEFTVYVSEVLKAFSKFYVLTNKSKLQGCVTNLILIGILIQYTMNSRFYSYIHSNNMSVRLPAGIAKLLDYICIPSRKFNSEDFSSFEGRVINSFNMLEFVEFLKKEFNSFDEHGNATVCTIANVQFLQRTLTNIGFSLRDEEVHEILIGITSELSSRANEESALFDLAIDMYSLCSTYVTDIPFVDYAPLRQTSATIGVHKFRNSKDGEGYLIIPRVFRELEVISQQISFCYLFICRPTFIIDGIQGYFPLPDDGTIDLSSHKLATVLSTLLSVQAVEALSPYIHSPARSLDNQTRSYVTLSSLNSVDCAIYFRSQRFLPSTRVTEKTIFYSAQPLVITIKDSS